MNQVDSERKNFFFGLTFSILVHVFLVIALTASSWWQKEKPEPKIYSVTIEGGKQLGGVSQAPKTDKKEQVAPPKKTSAQEKKVETKKEEIVKKKVEPVKKEKPVKKVEEPQKKEVKKEEKPVEKKQVEKKTLEKAVEKKEPEKKQEKPKNTAEDIQKKYQQAMQRYTGESADAGGQGFGAAKLGGRSMGGGQQVPLEVLQYRSILANFIKSGWRWHDVSANLTATVYFEISPTGELTSVKLDQSSGNREYDDSAVRAVFKASPVPPPPPSVYQEYFKYVRMKFDPRD